MSAATTEGKNSIFMMFKAVTCPPIHSMVVVTSPMGDQAPPALAEITMMPAKNKRSSRSLSNFFIKDTMTMVVVKLSNTALMKKVTAPTNHIKVDRRLVRMRWVITSNPLCASTTSTMVIAPIRKKMICAVPTKDSFR